MKNFEKYIDSIEQIIVKNHGCNGLYEEIYSKECGVWCSPDRNVRLEHCKKCVMYGLKDWLNQEYVEPIHLTHDEYVILKNLDSDYEWIWRDINEFLWVYDSKPTKDSTGDYWHCDGCYHGLPFIDLFQFIKWEDEPYEIAKLIADYEKENEDENC